MSPPVLNHIYNQLGQPIGLPLPDWKPPVVPARSSLMGRYCHLEPLDCDSHVADLFASNALDTEQRIWTYLPYGPFDSFADYAAWIHQSSLSSDPLFFAVVDGVSQRATGVVSYLRIEPKSGSIEVGHLAYSPRLQRTQAATEAMYLMMRQAFDLGYRRYEWKCDALNAPSRAAALRLGFTFEGIFRQATVYKQRTRDTAWYSIIDSEWPALDRAFQEWLALDNFDDHGQQRQRLSELIARTRQL